MTGSAGTVRAVTAEEADEFLRLLCAAFGLTYAQARPLFYQDPFFDLSDKRALRLPGAGFVSCLTIIPCVLRVGGAEVPAGGIAGVATHPDHRGRGCASRLLAETLRAPAGDWPWPLSLLFAFVPSFYRRFGWETASRSFVWSGTPADLPAGGEAFRVRACASGDLRDREAIHAVYAEATRGRTGACVRDERRWRVIEDLTPGREVAVFEARPGRVEGYVSFFRRFAADPERAVLQIQEMHGLSEGARRGLLGFLARQTGAAIEWPASPADLRAFGLPPAGPDARPVPSPDLMLRLVDLSDALARVHAARFAPWLAETGATLTVRARDPLRPQNERPVRLEAGGVREGTEEDAVWIAADIQTLAQIYLGCLLPSQAREAGRLECSGPESVALADRLFPDLEPLVAPPDRF